MSLSRYFATRHTTVDDGDTPRFHKASPREMVAATLLTAAALGLFVAAGEKFNNSAGGSAKAVPTVNTPAEVRKMDVKPPAP